MFFVNKSIIVYQILNYLIYLNNNRLAKRNYIYNFEKQRE